MKKTLSIKLSTKKKLYFSFEIGRYLINTHKKAKPQIENKNYDKVFCIGFNKTGTTSLEKALTTFGFSLGNQPAAEMLITEYMEEKYDRIIRFCHTADAFQDAPFSLPGLYKVLDKEFPKSKFILTVRDSDEQWYNSLIKFHTKLYSSDKNRIPNEEDLSNALYRYKGLSLETKKIYGYPEVPLYDENKYREYYNNHNKSVREYFRNRDKDLLVLNVAENGSYKKLADFLGVTNLEGNENFPWLNKTHNV